MFGYDELIKNINILLADDDEDYLTMTYAFLKQLGYNVEIATDGEQAIKKLKTNNFQIALLDYFMPVFNGEEVVKEIRKTNQELIIILQTGFSGQKPPIEMMHNLNIQNYYDKTEGIQRLNLELISAVKIFNQQNEIELSRYKANAIGNLIAGVAQEIKSNLMSVSAGMELTNILVQSATSTIEKQNLEKLNSFYGKNKESLEVIDKVLNSIIGQTKDSSENIMIASDVIDIINLIIKNIAKTHGVSYSGKIAVKENSYLTGNVNDTIFIICEILNKIINVQESGDNLELILTDDSEKWYFNVTTEKISKVSKSDIYILKKIILSLKGVEIEASEDKIALSMLKKIQ
jgi:CheY-like chemotaxis protein